MVLHSTRTFTGKHRETICAWEYGDNAALNGAELNIETPAFRRQPDFQQGVECKWTP
jgi:hypothetical protein